MCEVVLNYVEFGAIARCVVWSLLYCGALMPCGFACGALCFVLMLCICSVSALRWRDRYHAVFFLLLRLCFVVLC